MESLNVTELKSIAKKNSLKCYSKMRKEDFITALQDMNIIEEPFEVNTYRCHHGKIKYFCKECGGKGICEHGFYRRHCKDCKGLHICKHYIRRAYCEECGGSQLCLHGKHKAFCKYCPGSQICKHGRQKYSCRKCKLKK